MKRSVKPKRSSRRSASRRTTRTDTVVTAVTAAATLSDAAHSTPALPEATDSQVEPTGPVADQPVTEVETTAKKDAPEVVPDSRLTTENDAGVTDAPAEEFLGFRLDAEEYCLWIRSVREIIRPTEVTPIPRGPLDIMGIISLRGSIVPVFDVRRRLGMPARESDPRCRIVVVVIDGAPVGMVVDHVTEVISAEPGALGPPPTTMGEREAGFVTATLRHRERLIGVLHLERLVAVDTALQRAAA